MKFEDAIKIILEKEGGYVDHKEDPGGETNFGISKRAYPDLDIKSLTQEAAIEIYKRDFWDRNKIESLPPYLRLIVFDACINQGPGVAVGLLQAALGVRVDGTPGPETFRAISQTNPEKLILAYTKFRLNRYMSHPKFAFFGSGWINRLLEILIKSSGFVGKA